MGLSPAAQFPQSSNGVCQHQQLLGCLPLHGALLGEGLCSSAKMDLKWAAASEELLKGGDPFLLQKSQKVFFLREGLVIVFKLKTRC